jgi:hypothetical protein
MCRRDLLILLCLACSLTIACRGSRVETQTTNTSAPVQRTPNEPVDKQAPKATEAELRDVIARNYKDAVIIDISQSVLFLTGDFNGDNSEDIAIVVKPGKGKLSVLNSEYANWIVEDPHQKPPEDQQRRPPPVFVQRNDLLLAVIHGHEREGWRHALATQTYLLRNAVGEELETTRLIRGDVIREKLDGTAGIIYWTGAKYAWRPVS